MKKQLIYLMTDDNCDSSRADEINKLFKRYDIKVVSASATADEGDIRALLEQGDTDVVVLAVIYIKNQINIADVNDKNKHSGFVTAQDESLVYSYKLEQGELRRNSFSSATEGYLTDILGHQSAGENDFLLKNSMLTYSQLDDFNMKNTSQGLAVSKFICDQIYYSPPVNLNFNPQKLVGSIDFRNDPADFLQNNIYFNNPRAIQYGLTNLFHTVMNKGIFFKAAKNRREKNYWCPPLNAGLPLVPKRDVIHEITYMAHDFSHFLIPDLLYTGVHNAQNQQTYIAYRMMSEACTLVLADMVFVDSLKKCDFEYDYTKRKIYPLFEEFDIDLSDERNFLPNIKRMLRASVDYCLKGDDSGFYELSRKYRGHTPNLDNFKEKYMKFFCEDFKWTRHNYSCFRAKSEEISRWWELVSPLRDKAGLDTETIAEFSTCIAGRADDLIDAIFDELYTRISLILQKKPVTIDAFEKRRKKAFYRYMMGQFMLFVRFEPVVREAKIFQKIILNYLLDMPDRMSFENIDFVRTIIADFVDLLLDKNLINYDDALTFKEIFPVFEPSFAFYDEKIDFYKDLSIVAYESIYSAQDIL